MRITNQTRLNMVIGNPLLHTQSPVLHDAIYQQLDMNAVMIAQPHSHLQSLVRAIKSLAIGLTAVTRPYKEEIIIYADELSIEVSSLQAANTLIQRDGIIRAYNTDIDGIAFALRNISIRSKRVVVIGAGGAARAAGYFLQQNQAKIYFLNRTQHKAVTLADDFGGEVIDYDKLNSMEVDIIINTTPIGLYPHIDASPIPDYQFKSSQIIFDMVYNPVATSLLRSAQLNHATTISGLDMFIGQGIKQIELFTGKSIDASSMVDMLRTLLINNQRVTQP